MTEEKKPWEIEPNRVQWIYKDLDCMILRNVHGAWCGYVGIPESHPDYKVEYHDIQGKYDVHGELTFSDKCVSHICHEGVVANKDVWWLGFDCAHFGDYIPSTEWPVRTEGEEYRDIHYVTAETNKLADQLRESAQWD